MTPSIFELLLRLARGQFVGSGDAMAVLLREATDSPDDRARTERTARIKARNGALQRAAVELGADQPGAWVLAGRLAAAVARFEARQWPLLRAGLHRGELTPAEDALHVAFLTGQHIPRTQRRLYQLLT